MPIFPDEIATTLRLLGALDTDDKTRSQARARLEAAPLSELLETVPTLWEWAYTASKLSLPRLLVIYVVGVAVLVSIFWLVPLLLQDDILRSALQEILWVLPVAMLLALGVGVPVALFQIRFSPSRPDRLNALQRGIVRLCHDRPNWQFIPILIEALPFPVRLSDGPTAKPSACAAVQRALLTELLPQWCRETTMPLTPRQQSILLSALQQIAFRRGGIFRRRSLPVDSLSKVETNYCHAILQALQLGAISTGESPADERVRPLLARLPRTLMVDTAKHSDVQEATRTALAPSRGDF